MKIGENSSGAPLSGESGQAVTEYVLLLLFTLGVTIGLTRSILGAIDTGILRLGGQLQKDLKSGRSPNGTWKN
jgi:hypothetical protein